MLFSPPFPDAARDYRLLLDRGYPSSASLKLVGDRYCLDSEGRMILFRGILPTGISKANSARILPRLPAGARVAVDGYNVLFTLLNYRKGHPLFIATDGFLRDAGGAHGRIHDEAVFRESIGLLAERLGEAGVSEASVFLDSPVSGSARHAVRIREALASAGVAGGVFLASSADPPVRDFEGGAAATSDSVVAASARSPVFDLARDILETRYQARFQELSAYMPPSPDTA